MKRVNTGQKIATLTLLFTFLATFTPTQSAETLEFTTSLNGPETSVVSADKASVWVMSYDNSSLKQYSTSTGQLLNTVSVGGSAFDIAMTPDGSKIYVALNAISAIAVVNTSTATLARSITTPTNSTGIAVSPDGANVWVSTNFSTIRKISTSTDSITANYTAPGATVYDMKFSPDGTYIYLADSSNSRIVKYQTSDFTLVGSATGIATRYIAISPDGTFGYSFPYSGNNVYKFATNPMSLTNTISGFGSPSQANFTPDGQFVYVPNGSAKSVIRIKTSDNSLTTVFTGLTGTPWHSTIDPSGRYFFVSSSGTPGAFYQYNLGMTFTPASVALNLLGAHIFRSSTTISVTTSASSGKVTFYARGKYIPNCKNLSVTTTTTTCSFRPSGRGSVPITAVYVVNGTTVRTSAEMIIGNRTSVR
jgi:DNA-binding beta-propeller fold protein YncE